MKIFTLEENTTSLKLNETQANMQNVHIKNTTNSCVEKNARAFRFLVFVCLIFTTLILGFANLDSAQAKSSSKKASKAVNTKPYSAIVVDAATGEVLMARQADSIRHPASLTKMMTLYMVFAALESGQLRMNDRITISSHAASMSPSKMGIPVGKSIAVEDAIQALVTKSANDVAAAVAERLGGTERGFCAKMTRKAQALGMSRTTFRNASGLPDPQQVTTARDMAKLAMALLRDYPQYYRYFGVRNFEYKGTVIPNHNRLLGEYPGLDGIKTGYINASGFNLVASAKQDGRRLVGVVFGGQTWRSRNNNMVQILNAGFAELDRRRTSGTQVAVNNTALPIPLPNAVDEAAAIADVTMQVQETDIAEDNAAYTPDDGRSISAMIDQAQQQTAVSEAVAQAAPAVKTASVPIPAQRPALEIIRTPKPSLPLQAAVAPSAGVKITNTPTTPASAARTVMQLRVPAAQAHGIPPQQIASNQPRGWSIQVGAFPSRAMTDQALRTAQSRLPSTLQGGQPVIVPQNTQAGMIFRARLQGYDQGQANSACAHLGSCLVVAPGS